ncbi:MAG: HD family phosphohydrolase [Nitrospinaceae bacterium]|nr:MAG: HD family phosphohydrolase [Nitrospinaceae bacterium]
MKQDIESILNQSNQASSLPPLFNKINDAVEDPECSFMEIARLISGDSVLSAHLLKLANSSFFGFPSQIETITHAVTVIGMAQIRDLVLAMTVTDRFKNICPKLIDMQAFWFHSVACGLAARVIATFRHEANVERYYVLGMFHDLGRLIFLLQFGESVQEIFAQVKEAKKSLPLLERDIIGCDHAELGGGLLKKWGLPESLSEAVSFHSSPARASQYAMETAILHIADIIAHGLSLGYSGNPYVPEMDPVAWEKIDLPVSLLPAIVKQIDRLFPDTAQMFLPEE